MYSVIRTLGLVRTHMLHLFDLIICTSNFTCYHLSGKGIQYNHINKHVKVGVPTTTPFNSSPILFLILRRI
jgi:hypothetical protein